MRFTCQTSALIDGLQTATRALSARTTNPILEGVLLEAYGDELLLICSDERLTIATRIPAEVREVGRGVIPGRLFSEIARRLPGERAEVSMTANCQFTIKSLGYVINLAGQEAELYPRLPVVEDARGIALPQATLRDMIQKTEFAIAQSDLHEVLTGCLLEIDGAEARMVSTDGFRMALCQTVLAGIDRRVAAIIPGRAVGDIGKLLSDDEERLAALSFDGNWLHIGLGSTDIFAVLIAGEYIQYQRIIPADFATKVTVDLDEFRKCIDCAALIAREGNNNRLLLRISDGTMHVEAFSQIGDVHEALAVQQAGEDREITFNVKYLTDVVRSVDAGELEICLNSSVSPCVMRPVGNADYFHIVLPVRTQA